LTDEEKDIICTLYNEHGSCWTGISRELKGRTANMIKNYWYGKRRKRCKPQKTRKTQKSQKTRKTQKPRKTRKYRKPRKTRKTQKPRKTRKYRKLNQILPELEPERRIKGFPSKDEINLVRENWNVFGLQDMNFQWSEPGVDYKNLDFSEFHPYEYDYESLQPPRKRRKIESSFEFERKKWHRLELEKEIIYIF